MNQDINKMKTIVMQQTFPLFGEAKLRELVEKENYKIKRTQEGVQYLIKEE